MSESYVQPETVSRARRYRRAVAGIGCALIVAGCGSGGSPKASTTTTLPVLQTLGTTTTTLPQAAVEVRPPSAPVGTSFQLLATRFQPAEMVTIEIDLPDGKVFKGPRPHAAAADGSFTATYQVTTANPVGVYQVKLTGDKGSQAVGQLEATASTTATTKGSTTATTKATATTTPARTTTTRAGVTTTSKY